MDINDFRSWHTVVMLAIFIGIIVWAYSKKRTHAFDEAAHLPFEDDATHKATLKKEDIQ